MARQWQAVWLVLWDGEIVGRHEDEAAARYDALVREECQGQACYVRRDVELVPFGWDAV